jgi:outer membrane protein assembly factor BamB
MVSSETGLADSFDPATGKNIKWTVKLGSETYATPVIANGKVFIGTNNRTPRDPRHEGDRALLYCLDEQDGRLLWQLVVPKLTGDPFDPYLDWPGAGICSPPTVEGDRVYVLSNRGEVMCLDINGLADGNDGPYQDEAHHMVPKGEPPMELGELDADILWLFDMRAETKYYPHDGAHSSILMHGDFLYLNTGNGVDNTHKLIRAPEAPSLIAIDKKTGRWLARDIEPIGPRIFHCTWSSPSLGKVNGRDVIFFGGGDGICYAFEALRSKPETVEPLKKVWSFDCDPTAPKENVSQYMRNRKVSPSNIKGMPVFLNGRIYVTSGGDIWWGKREARIQCIDASGVGDVTGTKELWSYPLVNHCCATPSIHDGLVYIADCGKTVHCIDAETGKPYWTHKTNGKIWGSTMVADGKVYVGTRKGDFWVLAASKEKKILSTVELGSPISGNAVPANGALYLSTMTHLYAIEKTSD